MRARLFEGLDGLPKGLPIVVQGSIANHVRHSGAKKESIMFDLLNYLFVCKNAPYLVVPAFTFSVFSSLLFSPEARSEMGYISRYVEDYTTYSRTSHPIYSFYCVSNPYKGELTYPLNADSFYCFGDGTFYDYVAKSDAIQVCLNLQDSKCMTFYHHAEKIFGAEHRQEKVFPVKTIRDNTSSETPCSVYVRKPGVVTKVDGIERMMWDEAVWRGQKPVVGNPTERWCHLTECLRLFSGIDMSDHRSLLYEVE